MKKCRFFLIFVLLSVCLSAQVSLDESLLPSVNETTRTLVDNMPMIDLKKQGADQYWDFSLISSGLAYESTFLETLPEVSKLTFAYDFLRKDDEGWIHFYEKTSKHIYEIALQRPHPLNSAKTVVAQYDSPLLIMYAPLEYKSDLTNRSSIALTLAANDIPSIINKRLPVTADSLRVIYNETRDFRVDAWGTLVLSYDRFDVLRQEVSSLKSISVEIYTAGRWSEIDNSILDPAGDLLGISQEREFLFYSDQLTETVAKITLDEFGQAAIAEIRASDDASGLVNANTTKQELVLSPNPTYGDIKLELMNLDYGKYNFEVFNILSKKLWGEEIVVDRKLSSQRYNFSFLGKGTYLWSITDAQGVRITTKRMVIITP
jgi:hypothetical protein